MALEAVKFHFAYLSRHGRISDSNQSKKKPVRTVFNAARPAQIKASFHAKKKVAAS
jgi:hypothetical protein